MIDYGIERQFVRSFILKDKRERAIFELGNPKLRHSFIMKIGSKLDRNLFQKISRGNAQQTLKAAGAPDVCYFLSGFEENDGKEYSLEQGLDILDYEYEVMVCIPQKLAVFRETPTDFYILKK